MSGREDALAVLAGRRPAGYPCVSGLIGAVATVLEDLRLELPGVHADPVRMAAAAAGPHRRFGLGSAVVPLDMCVEAELLGAPVEFGGHGDPRLPSVGQPPFESAAGAGFDIPRDPVALPRVTTVLEALQILRREVGEEAAVGATVPGPYTLATLLIDLAGLLGESRAAPDVVGSVLDRLTDLLAIVAGAYRAGGADFVTIHEMGGSPGFIGPGPFEALVLPRLRRLREALPAPVVLSVCGRTDRAIELLGAVGADALSFDQLNDLAATRRVLGEEAVLLGNIDPVAVLAEGDGEAVRAAVAEAIEAGADAVWPGCDLVPGMPGENLRVMVEESARHRRPA